MYDLESRTELLAGVKPSKIIDKRTDALPESSVIVRVISLVRSTERRATMTAQLDKIEGLNWSFFDALEVLPDFLKYDVRRTRAAIGRELSTGEIGCFASHFSLWRWFLESSHDILIVLEDDLLLDAQFFSQASNFCKAVSEYEYVRLYAKAPAKAIQMKRLMGRYIVRYRHFVFGTQGYVLRRSGAAKLCRSTRTITRPIDIEIDRYWAHGVRNIGLTPAPMIEVQIQSTIGDDRLRPRELTLGESLLWIQSRAIEMLRRRTCNLGYLATDLYRILKAKVGAN